MVVSLIDIFQSPKQQQLTFKRSIPEEMERGLSYEVDIEVLNTSIKSFQFRIVDEIPQSFQRSFPIHGIVAAQGKTVVSYQITAPVRGKYTMNKLYVRYRSNFGLWEKQVTIKIKDVVKVIPDLTETRHYLENAQRFLLEEGNHIRKQQSNVGEFAKIRNYVVGDDPRKINWRQTAKLHQVMTNEYEPEHGKYVTILIDCGRMMGAELKTGNRLEKVLEACITVAAAALRKGDYVAVLAFSKDIHAYVAPAKGMDHLQKIMKTIYHVQVDASESNYAQVFYYLQTVQNKRSLVLLFSDVGTFLHEESGLLQLKRLRQKHLFFIVGIEDESLVQHAKNSPETTNQAMVKSIAQQQLLVKQREKHKWEQQGLLMMEVREERLATAAVSQYIDFINRGLL